MRCLYCGKELALLKRLTGGAEFCSDAHRKSYQSEYNDLALSRLLQAKNVADPLPELKAPGAPAAKSKAAAPAKPANAPTAPAAPTAQPVAATVAQTPAAIIHAHLPEGTPGQPMVAQVSITVAPAGSVNPTETVEVLPAPPEPQPEEIIRAMWGPIVEQPVAAAPDPIEIPIAAITLESQPEPVFPARDMQDVARDFGLDWANPVTWRPPAEALPGSRRPFQRSLDTRDFSRHGAAPELPSHPEAIRSNPELNSEHRELEATQTVRKPGPAKLWHIGALHTSPVEPMLGELASNNFELYGIEPRQLDATVEEPRVQAPPPTIAPEPEAVIPEAAPVIAVDVPRVVAPADAVLQPVPVTLSAIAAQVAAPKITFTAAPLVIEPQIPAATALPIRPVIVLGPKVEAKPVPAEPPKLVSAPVPAARVVRSSSGKKRNDVRVTPVAPVKPAVVAAPPAPVINTVPVVPETAVAQVPATPGAPVVVVVTSGPGMNVQASSLNPAIEVIQPDAPVAIPAPATPLAAPAPVEPEINLHLPEFHMQEVPQGFWAKLPSPVKIGIAAALVLTISGFAYFALNSSKASATTTPVATAKAKTSEMPAYKQGQQINSGGWIEDWAPNDSLRRVTLLRGSTPFSDYRMQFSAQIQKKAIGWMFRGINPKNFYVVKLEKQTSGIEPIVALVRYAVIDGKNESRVETVLPMKVRVDTTYKIRFDAVGPNFAVWVNGQQIDQWKDTRLGSGGLGLYSEGDEAAAVHGNVDVFSLVASK